MLSCPGLGLHALDSRVFLVRELFQAEGRSGWSPGLAAIHHSTWAWSAYFLSWARVFCVTYPPPTQGRGVWESCG